MKEKISAVPKIRFDIPDKFSPYRGTWFTQLLLLLKRSFLNYFRNYRVVINDVIMAFVSNYGFWSTVFLKFFCLKLTAILGGIIYFHSGEKTDGICIFNQKTSQNISTALFYTVTVMTIISVLAAAMTFPLEIPIFMREV